MFDSTESWIVIWMPFSHLIVSQTYIQLVSSWKNQVHNFQGSTVYSPQQKVFEWMQKYHPRILHIHQTLHV